MKKDNKSDNQKLPEQTVDAAGVPLGRLATRCAFWLQGKHLPEYSPEKDLPVTVRVQNADKVVLTGRKQTDKVYQRATGYPGKIKTEKASELMQDNPGEMIRRAVRGMLPVNTLRKPRLKRLVIETSNSNK